MTKLAGGPSPFYSTDNDNNTSARGLEVASTAQRMMALFAGNADAHGTHGVPEQDPGSVKWHIKRTAKSLREPVTEELWEQHLAGTRPLGVIPIRGDGTCSWGSIDIDDYNLNLIQVVQKVESMGLPLVPCRSKSGGLHLFLFMREPVPAGSVQAVLRDMSASLGFAGSEIFPKQTHVLNERGDMGNWMVVPYYGDTFGGKIAEQVGLKKTGAEMSVEEFVAFAESKVMGLAEIPASRHKPKKSKTASGQTPGLTPGGPFSDGPPCLQHLSAQGIQRGGQSNALFHMGVYYKRAFPEDWKERLEKANQEYLKPPGTSDGLTSVIRSLEKKDYEYTCKSEPMVSHCNATLCRTRKFGVGSEGNFPAITGIAKLDTDPPLWFVDVGDQRVECTTEQLQSYFLFHRLCMDRGRCYAMIKTGDWLAMVSAAMEGMTTIEAPPEVGTRGQFFELLEEFLTNRSKGIRREDLLMGRPFEDKESGRHYFRLKDLMKFLQREGVRDREMTQARITQRIKDLGGGSHGLNAKGKYISCWFIPSSVVTPATSIEPPPVPGSPV